MINTNKTLQGKYGTAEFQKREDWGTKKKAFCLFNSYSPEMLCPSGDSASFLSVSTITDYNNDTSTTHCFRLRGAADPFLYSFPDVNYLKIDFTDENANSVDYSAKLCFFCKDKNEDGVTSHEKDFYLKISRNGTEYIWLHRPEMQKHVWNGFRCKFIQSLATNLKIQITAGGQINRGCMT